MSTRHLVQPGEGCNEAEALDTLPGFPGVEVRAQLSHGNDLDVFDVWCPRRRARCVLKTVRADRVDDEDVVERLHREAALLLRLTHPHIVRAYGSGTHPRPYLLVETLTGYTLEALLRRKGSLCRPDLLHLADHLSAALAYLHEEGILHLDLKPSNIVSEGGRAKLIDFSLAHAPGVGPKGWGTPRYLAPEQGTGGPFTTATDVWGLGIVLHEAATGRRVFAPDPPSDAGGPDDYPQLTMPAPSLRAQRRLPAGVRDLVERSLRLDPAERPGLEEIRRVVGTALVAAA